MQRLEAPAAPQLHQLRRSGHRSPHRQPPARTRDRQGLFPLGPLLLCVGLPRPAGARQREPPCLGRLRRRRRAQARPDGGSGQHEHSSMADRRRARPGIDGDGRRRAGGDVEPRRRVDRLERVPGERSGRVLRRLGTEGQRQHPRRPGGAGQPRRDVALRLLSAVRRRERPGDLHRRLPVRQRIDGDDECRRHRLPAVHRGRMGLAGDAAGRRTDRHGDEGGFGGGAERGVGPRHDRRGTPSRSSASPQRSRRPRVGAPDEARPARRARDARGGAGPGPRGGRAGLDRLCRGCGGLLCGLGADRTDQHPRRRGGRGQPRHHPADGRLAARRGRGRAGQLHRRLSVRRGLDGDAGGGGRTLRSRHRGRMGLAVDPGRRRRGHRPAARRRRGVAVRHLEPGDRRRATPSRCSASARPWTKPPAAAPRAELRRGPVRPVPTAL